MTSPKSMKVVIASCKGKGPKCCLVYFVSSWPCCAGVKRRNSVSRRYNQEFKAHHEMGVSELDCSLMTRRSTALNYPRTSQTSLLPTPETSVHFLHQHPLYLRSTAKSMDLFLVSLLMNSRFFSYTFDYNAT